MLKPILQGWARSAHAVVLNFLPLCAAPLVGEMSREPRRGGALGSPFLGLLSFGEAKESD
jgi:hypothetical protein